MPSRAGLGRRSASYALPSEESPHCCRPLSLVGAEGFEPPTYALQGGFEHFRVSLVGCLHIVVAFRKSVAGKWRPIYGPHGQERRPRSVARPATPTGRLSSTSSLRGR